MEEWGTGGRDGWTHGRTRQRTNNQQEMAAAICRHCGKKRPHETRKEKLSRRCSSLPSPFLSYGQNDCFRQAPPRRSEAALAAAACFLLCARLSPSPSLTADFLSVLIMCVSLLSRGGAAAAAMKTIMANSSLSFSYGEVPNHDAPLECLPSDPTEEVT